MLGKVFHSKTVAAISAWITIFSVVFWGLAKLTPSWFGQLTWSQLALLAIGSSVATLFVVAASVALFATAFRKAFPAPASEISEELERTKARLARAEKRLDGAQVVPAELHANGSGSTGQIRLTGVERERATAALCDMFDYLGGALQDFYHQLAQGHCGLPADLIAVADGLQPARQMLANDANALWQRHSHYMELTKADILPVLRDLEAMDNPMRKAVAARDWPTEAQNDAVKPLQQKLSDLGGNMGNLRKAIAEARQEIG